MTNEVSLKPCPFCGAPAAFTPETAHQYATVSCSQCPCDMDLGRLPEREVIAAWNSRAAEPLREALRKVCEHSARGSVVYQIAAGALVGSPAEPPADPAAYCRRCGVRLLVDPLKHLCADQTRAKFAENRTAE